MQYDDSFRTLSGGHEPRDWQRTLASDTDCLNRTARIPTGFGKTLGAAGAWIWNRIIRNDNAWPQRLVWCLPMRVLAEQTAAELRAALNRLGMLWDNAGCHDGKVGVHVLMGGSEPGPWHQYPEHCAVIIGTQDMLLSRALNRGYAAPRARWPMDFGLLNQDCLWVMDEIQLMDVGLATSAQLQAFRDDDRAVGRSLRPCVTWWMSATLQADWLAKSPDTKRMVRGLKATEIPPERRTGPLWDDVAKPCQQIEAKSAKELAPFVIEQHVAGECGAAGPTIVVLNTVDRAVELWDALRKTLAKERDLAATDLRLVHSRFRPQDRSTWATTFLNRDACAHGTNRIIVSTQVIEAGVDISAGLLVTELAPWASLVQRFGRAARWGGCSEIIVVRFDPLKSPLPYTQHELNAALTALTTLAADAPEGQADVGPLALARLEEQHPDLVPSLFPFEPKHLLLRHELDELFDTTPDLSGADIDISRFIRSGAERDLFVFWQDVEPKTRPSPDIRPTRDALCPVPFLAAQQWLCDKQTLAKGKRAWVWDWQDGGWRVATKRDMYPGNTLLVAADTGGYDPTRGFDPKSTAPVPPTAGGAATADALTDDAQDNEALSQYEWKTIATHGREAGTLAQAIAQALAPDLAHLLDLGGRWHDAGKAHSAFRGSIAGDPDSAPRDDLAKAPQKAWQRQALYRMPDGSRRPGLRHELASTLALFGVLQRHNPDHPALLQPWRELLAAMGTSSLPRAGADADAPSALEQEVLALDAPHFDLLAYLVCAHHGKLRLAWHAAKGDQSAHDTVLRIRGIRDGERLPPVPLADGRGEVHELPETVMDLAPAAAGISPTVGAGWTDRVLGLLDRHGPFTLAWLESLLRAADQRASQLDTHDPLLETPYVGNRLAGERPALAGDPAGGSTPDQLADDPAQGREEHGVRGGASGREDARSRAGAPPQATRYLDTTLGRLSYAQLAPHLARNVQRAEAAITLAEYAHYPLDEALIRDLHAAICADLVPVIAGKWRRVNVRVSQHEAPPFLYVPILMRDYCRDVQARIGAIADLGDRSIPELLAFAEGRLLTIHPFTDFNGRTSRLLLAELLRRLKLPALDPTPAAGDETSQYLSALAAADRTDWGPLTAIWEKRLA
jgi:CRISPR-associated endonuclease/helicase Cas3